MHNLICLGVYGMNTKRAVWRMLSAVAAGAILLFGLAGWPRARAAVYRFYRHQGRVRTLDGLAGYRTAESPRFLLYYRPDDGDLAALILEQAEAVLDQVVEEVGYRPAGRVALILYPDRPALRAAYGWGSGQSAVGVYWRGTVGLLSPRVWIAADDPAELARAFRRRSPIAHELTHYLLDELTEGNYPRWFTEGLAQYVEERTTGYVWPEAAAASLEPPLYTLAELTRRFDDLPDRPRAYRQSHLLVAHLAEVYGRSGLTGLIALLGEGMPFDRAVEAALGRSMELIYADWLDQADGRSAQGRNVRLSERKGLLEES